MSYRVKCNAKTYEKIGELLTENDLLTENASLSIILKGDMKLPLKDLIDSHITEIGEKSDSSDVSHLASSGNYSQLANSGDYSRLAASGNLSQLAASGYNSHLAASGNHSQLAVSGGYSRLAASGDVSRLAASGNHSQLAVSGNHSLIEINGNSSIGFACGADALIKGITGTWISLAEYDDYGNIPVFAKSAQIGNIDYKDCFGKILKKDTFYQLINKEFTPVIEVDSMRMVVISSKKMGEYRIFKTQFVQDFKNSEKTYQYVAQKDGFTAHGETIKQAMQDVEFKRLQSQDVQEHVQRIKKQGFITPNDYRLLTGACQYGTNRWLEENGFTWEDKKSIDEVIKLTEGQYGHERVVGLLKGVERCIKFF